MSTNQAIQELDQKVCQAADKFSKLFYEAFDKRRAVVGKMYTDGASMVWNGNAVVGKEDIQNFITNLPESEFTVASLDAQSVDDKLTNGKSTMVLLVSGSVKYDNRWHTFTQTFILSAEEDVWKISSDRFRFID